MAVTDSQPPFAPGIIAESGIDRLCRINSKAPLIAGQRTATVLSTWVFLKSENLTVKLISANLSEIHQSFFSFIFLEKSM
jgi:hypothetical protein